jgi:hypothetical protein
MDAVKKTRRPRTKTVNEVIKESEKEISNFESNLINLTQDEMNKAPKYEVEPQTKLSTREQQKSKDIYLKPKHTIGARDKFNEKFRASYEYARQYVQFIAEHKELIGENIEIWTRPYGGMAAEEWEIPTNKPVWGPRYLAEQIRRKKYHRLVMKQTAREETGMGQFYGVMAADTTISRLDANPVSTSKTIFLG